jgi:hypothetical protein
MEAQSLYANYSASSSVIILPEESSFNGIYFILSNIIPAPSLTVQPQFYQSGNPIASASTSQPVQSGKNFVHIEAYKMLNGQFFPLDPTQFLQPDLNVSVSVQLECNDVVTYVEGMVVERRNVLSSADVSRMQIGDPLVEGNEKRFSFCSTHAWIHHNISLSLCLRLSFLLSLSLYHITGIPGHEFPQPYDLVIESSDSITSGATPVQFFQSSTFIMVGQIPVQFGKSYKATSTYCTRFPTSLHHIHVLKML